jgi:hypothetical protein
MRAPADAPTGKASARTAAAQNRFTTSVSRKHSPVNRVSGLRHLQVPARWLLRYLDENGDATIGEVVFPVRASPLGLDRIPASMFLVTIWPNG